MSNYFANRDELLYNKIDNILGFLPDYVGYFISGIANRTSMLTRFNYATDLRLFFWYLSKYKFNKNPEEVLLCEIELLTSFEIEKFANFLSLYKYNGKTLSCGEKAKERKLSTLRSFFKYLFMKDFIKSNVMVKVEMPKIHDKPIVKLDINEIKKLLDTAENGENLSARQQSYNQKTCVRDIAILATFLGTGIRVSELVGLNIRDLDFNNNAFSITRKGGNKSILYFPEETVSALTDYLAWRKEQLEALNSVAYGGNKAQKTINSIDVDALFYSMKGNLISGQRITVRAVENLVQKYSGIAAPLKHITPHKLRSTYATNLYKNTGDIYVVADVLGHSDINTTKKHYAEMSEDNKKYAAKITVLRKKEENDDK